jgi:hypothetical protein
VLRAALVTLAAAVLLAACGSSEEAVSPPPSNTVATSLPEASEAPSRDALPDLGVGLSDLPQGFSLVHERFISTEAPMVAGYRREFDPGTARLGDSQLAGLTSDVVLFESADAADSALARVLVGLLAGNVEKRFAEIVRVSAGIDATNIQGETLATDTLGDGAVVSHATFDTDVGRAEAVFVVARVGPLQQSVFLLGPPGDVQVNDATNLVKAVVPRLQEAAKGELAA